MKVAKDRNQRTIDNPDEHSSHSRSDRNRDDRRDRGRDRDFRDDQDSNSRRRGSFDRYEHSPVRKRDRSPDRHTASSAVTQCQIIVLGSLDSNFTKSVETALSRYVPINTNYLSITTTVERLERELRKYKEDGITSVVFIERSRQKMGMLACHINTPLGVQGIRVILLQYY